MLWVGVDMGGTFIDVVVHDARTGELRATKSPSSPPDPAAGVLHALDVAGVRLADVSRFRHGATVATNAALERAGSRLAVLTTRGHRDVLIVGRGSRTQLYDIKATRPPGLVRRAHVIEVEERLDADGNVLKALDDAALRDAIEQVRAIAPDAIAVCFLHAYANSAHEERAADAVRAAMPGVAVCHSAEVIAEQREYPRFATTALNAYVAPKMGHYLERLQHQLVDGGLPVAPEIMSSSGGSWSFSRMARLPVNSMLSGPAAGVIGAVEFAAALQVPDLITYDMGGTSTDTALVRGGRFELAAEGRIGDFPNRAPQIEINTVGAGGGSLAYLDAGGFLTVGPRSAGAVPGPACYGRGGSEPTVTDANVVLGRLRASAPLGGEITLDIAAAQRAVDGLATALGLDRMATAEGIVRLAETRMTAAIKEISVMRGIDPRRFALLAYGGAGPLHAAAIAEELGLSTVIVPPLSGTFSAYGLLVAARRLDLSRTQVMDVSAMSFDDVRAVVTPLREAAHRELSAEGFGSGQIRIEASVDMRFRGQAFELNTPLADEITEVHQLVAAFHAVYEERYSHVDRGAVEVVSFRVAAYGESTPPSLPRIEGGGTLHAARRGERAIRLAGATLPTPVYAQSALPVDARLAGPAVIDDADAATTLVPTGFTARRHASGALFIERQSP